MWHDKFSPILTNSVFQTKLRSWFESRIGREIEMNDVLQDTWIKAHKSPIPANVDLFAWLFCVAQNCAWDTYKAESRRKSREKNRVQVARLGVKKFLQDQQSRQEKKCANYSSLFKIHYPEHLFKEQEFKATGSPSPSAGMERRELRAKIKQTIRNHLSVKYRYLLRAWMYNNAGQYAIRFGVLPVTVRVGAGRALQKLKSALENTEI